MCPDRKAFARAIQNWASQSECHPSGALAQVWFPINNEDGSTSLRTQGLPFAVAGSADGLALFRFASTKYAFKIQDCDSPSAEDFARQGAIGRVFTTGQPEFTHEVDRLDRQLYHRLEEARQCGVASHVVLPVFSAAEESSTGSTGSPPLVTNGTAVGGVPGDGGGPERVVAVVEVVQNDRALNFAEVGRVLGACLQVEGMCTCSPEQLQTVVPGCGGRLQRVQGTTAAWPCEAHESGLGSTNSAYGDGAGTPALGSLLQTSPASLPSSSSCSCCPTASPAPAAAWSSTTHNQEVTLTGCTASAASSERTSPTGGNNLRQRLPSSSSNSSMSVPRLGTPHTVPQGGSFAAAAAAALSSAGGAGSPLSLSSHSTSMPFTQLPVKDTGGKQPPPLAAARGHSSPLPCTHMDGGDAEPVGPTTTATAHTATTHTAAAHSFQTSHQGTQGIEGEEEGDDRKGEERGWALKRQVAHLADTLAGVADPTDRLTVLEVIGQGAFGLVFRGRWRNLDVAVKTVLFSDREASICAVPPGAGNPSGTAAGVCQPGGGEQHSGKRRALLEAAVCTSVDHPNVVATYTFDVTPVRSSGPPSTTSTDTTHHSLSTGLHGLTIDHAPRATHTDFKLYLVQELCQATLQDALDDCVLHDATNMAPHMDSLLLILADVARGCEYLHARGIIHGDLKPENVLLKRDLSSPITMTAKITDFGLCGLLDPGASHTSGFARGTPFFAAPEVAGRGVATDTSDVYGFGVLMWVLYTNQMPWVQLPTGTYTGRPGVGSLPPSAPPAFAALCAACMAPDPKARPKFSAVLRSLTRQYKDVLASQQYSAHSCTTAYGPGSHMGGAVSRLQVGVGGGPAGFGSHMPSYSSPMFPLTSSGHGCNAVPCGTHHHGLGQSGSSPYSTVVPPPDNTCPGMHAAAANERTSGPHGVSVLGPSAQQHMQHFLPARHLHPALVRQATVPMQHEGPQHQHHPLPHHHQPATQHHPPPVHAPSSATLTSPWVMGHRQVGTGVDLQQLPIAAAAAGGAEAGREPSLPLHPQIHRPTA